MSQLRPPKNAVAAHRHLRGWTQTELSQRAALPRASISAIEVNRLVPSVAAALALARALDCTVEELFGAGPAPADDVWAWPPSLEPTRYWQAEIGRRTLLFPVEATACGVLGHDGVYRNDSVIPCKGRPPEPTLVIATCDPAVALLAGELARSHRIRLIALPRSSRAALELLRQGFVHAAGIHFSTAGAPEANEAIVRECIGTGHRLLRIARWEEGLSLGRGLGPRSVRAAVNGNLRWVGREAGSAARQCLDELRPNKTPPRRLARDHRSVAEAIRCGWADVGVCLRMVAEEADLGFLAVREETYDLCYPVDTESDPRIQALVQAARSLTYRNLLGDLPGVETAEAGEVLTVS